MKTDHEDRLLCDGLEITAEKRHFWRRKMGPGYASCLKVCCKSSAAAEDLENLPVCISVVKRNHTLPFRGHPTLTSDNISITQIPSKHKDHQAADINAEDSDDDDDKDGG